MDSLDPQQQPLPCCVQLRCKSMYYRADERPGLLHNDESIGYWCAETNADLGPDNTATSHRTCQPGRACYKEGP